MDPKLIIFLVEQWMQKLFLFHSNNIEICKARHLKIEPLTMNCSLSFLNQISRPYIRQTDHK